MSIRAVIISLGGISGLSRGLKHRNPSTVQGWWEREVIPPRRMPEVLAYAQEVACPIDPLDLIPVNSGEESRAIGNRA